MCVLLFRNRMDDVSFMDHLAFDLGFENRNELTIFMNNHEKIATVKRGRPMSGQVARQEAYEFWKDLSSISNDRRNARHVTKIKPDKRDPAVIDLNDDR